MAIKHSRPPAAEPPAMAATAHVRMRKLCFVHIGAHLASLVETTLELRQQIAPTLLARQSLAPKEPNTSCCR